MKRLLSWIVLPLTMTVFYYIQYYFWVLVFYGYDLIATTSGILYWFLLLSYISILAGICLPGISAGAMICAKASNAICKTRNGARYIVFGVFYILWYIFILFGYRMGFVRGSFILNVFQSLTMIIFSILLIIMGKAEEL